MPSRVVRGSINSSESLARVSIGAELLFHKLVTHVDDYGRTDARPAVLRGALYALRPDFTDADVAGWLAELVGIDEPVPPVRVYQPATGGPPILELTGWERHRGASKRGKASRWPGPPPDPGTPAASVDALGRPRIPSDLRGDPPGESGSRGVEESGSRGETLPTGCAGRAGDSPPARCEDVDDGGRIAGSLGLGPPPATRTVASRWAPLVAAKHFRGDLEAATAWVADVLPELEAAAEAEIRARGGSVGPEAFRAAVRARLFAFARRRRQFDDASPAAGSKGRAAVVVPGGGPHGAAAPGALGEGRRVAAARGARPL